MQPTSVLATAMVSGLVMAMTLITGAPALQARPMPVPSDESQIAEQRIADLLDKRIVNKILGKEVSMVVLDSESGRLVFERAGSNKQFSASTMKIVTAMTTLATFTPQDSFTTRVMAGKNRKQVVLTCGGDPMLTTNDLRALARQTAQELGKGSSVTVLVDDNDFRGPVRGPGWPKEYISSVAADVSCLAQLGDYSATPSRNAARTFAKALRKQGIKARLGGSGVASANAKVLAQTSHTVRQAVDRMLLESENNVAEVLYRQVALKRGLPGTWAGGRRAAQQVLGELGVSTAGLRLMDGSGLSRRNRVTARFLAEVLRISRTNPRFATMYDGNAMPRAGMTGTLAAKYGRFNTSPSSCAKGEIRAKTGSLFDTISLAGVAQGEDGKDKVFAILVNDRPRKFIPLTTRRAVDKLASTITGCW
ncbi:MAG: D-alanyl-D-alanine carboxypeptidase/D-alanyl-D-alanine-endopeptidase [Actinomycetales bacterium]